MPRIPCCLPWSFFAYFLIDILYASYTLAGVDKRPVLSANLASLIYLLLALGVLSYTENAAYLFPMILGSWLGTFLTVRWHRQKEESSSG